MEHSSDSAPIESQRAAIFDVILREVQRQWSRSSPFVVGITGVDTAGKTCFTQALASFMEQVYHVQVIHVDDFHHPRATRSRGPNEVENYYVSTFDLELLQTMLLRPIRKQLRLTATHVALDLETDHFVHHRLYGVSRHRRRTGATARRDS